MSLLYHFINFFFFLHYFSLHTSLCLYFFFFNDTATTEIYTLSLHDALPISQWLVPASPTCTSTADSCTKGGKNPFVYFESNGTCWSGQNAAQLLGGGVTLTYPRSEEHTSELQSQSNLVCRLLLEKKKPRTRLLRCATRSPAALSRSRTTKTAAPRPRHARPRQRASLPRIGTRSRPRCALHTRLTC